MRHRSFVLFVVVLSLVLVPACGSSGGGGGSTDISPNPMPPDEGAPIASASFTYLLNKLNAIRTGRALTPFTQDGQLDTFAMNATRQLMIDGIAHNYFATYNGGCGAPGFNTMCAENQGWASGYGSDAANIDAIIDGMMAEETMYPPGDSRRGHFETIVNPALTRIGIGIAQNTAGTLYLTNDFSN